MDFPFTIVFVIVFLIGVICYLVISIVKDIFKSGKDSSFDDKISFLESKIIEKNDTIKLLNKELQRLQYVQYIVVRKEQVISDLKLELLRYQKIVENNNPTPTVLEEEYKSNLTILEEEYKSNLTILEKKYKSKLIALEEKCKSDLSTLEENLESNLTAFPYFASIIADYKTSYLDKMINELSWGNNVSRKKKVASLIEIKKETKQAIEQCKIAEYQLTYLKTLYPVIEDIIETDFRDLDVSVDISDSDPVRKYLDRDEYYKLSESERNQLALDRYIESRKKSKWQIGRDYELYVGYKYSLSGYSIDYFGSYMGVEDLGRDLIAKRDDITLVIQCKYWSKDKMVHEKHIAQLYGTYICYCIENDISSETVKPIFITSTVLTDVAKRFCEHLNIDYKENYDIGSFPRIKCNIGVDEFGSKTYIYHLPMDQQYDKVKITKSGECWAFTVKEAESLGFRRAYKWHDK